ncbi:MAG: ABC transporter substrate-binding protein [Oscillospiraceae bacterium]|nr:ABC transporter substrate-binding protein [Oscillospiraceae bacterium]
MNSKIKKIISICLLCALAVLSTASCGKMGSDNVQIKIAVLGDADDFYPDYEEGILFAETEFNEEYADEGYTLSVEFCDDDDDYNKGMSYVDELASDDSLTAVIASMDMEINKSAAYTLNESGKLFIVPYFLYDSVYTDNYYDTVFSMCASAAHTGKTLRLAAEDTGKSRWAVVSADGSFETDEVYAFINSGSDAVQIADCVTAETIINDFETVYSRWDSLGIEGVAMFMKDSEGFDIVSKLKSRNPDLIFCGDTAFDNTDTVLADSSLTDAMAGFIIADEFCFDYSSGDISKFTEMENEYYEETGEYIDLWFFQAYNAVRMVADTAVKIGSADSAEIAAELHENGYTGIGSSFEFDANGTQLINPEYYGVLNSGESTDIIMLK